jgi:signal transduction histidine kinase
MRCLGETCAVTAALLPLIDEAYLEDRLTALEAARAWSPRVVSRLEALIRSPDESGLFRVNPIKVAHERNIDEGEAIDLFLHASALAALRYGLALWSADQRLIYCNKAFADLCEPLSPFSKDLCLPEFLAKISGVCDVAPTSTSELTSRSPFEYVLSDGRTLEISVDTDSTGTTAMTVQDVTIEKRGERALRKAKEIAELADKTKSRFLRAANHDLRQPLAY